MNHNSDEQPRASVGRTLAGAGIALAALGAAAAYNRRATKRAETEHPPAGRFVGVQGVQLHYLEQGSGPPVVLLHGNGVTAEDWRTSGLFDALAATRRVIAFDRPGFGYSSRPRDAVWTPVEQAALLQDAWTQLGVRRPVVVAHSWATMVGVALGLDFPDDIERLVLVGGYYFPTLRLDSPIFGAPAVPVAGDVLATTVAPLLGRAMLPMLVRQLFAPAPVAERFARFPIALSLRPSQLRAEAMESLTMPAMAAMLEPRYASLRVPVTVISGDGDRVVDPHAQSDQFSHLVTGRGAHIVHGAGHMVHYAAPGAIVDAVETPHSVSTA